MLQLVYEVEVEGTYDRFDLALHDSVLQKTTALQILADVLAKGRRLTRRNLLSGTLLTSDLGTTYELNAGSTRFKTPIMIIRSLCFIAKRLLLSEQGPVSLDDEC